MRNFLLFLLFLIAAVSVNAQKYDIRDSLFLNSIGNTEFAKYEVNKKSVKAFLHDFHIARKEIFFLDEPTGMLYGIIVYVSDNLSVKFLITKYTHIVRFDEQRKWNKRKVLREKIYKIRVEYKDSCFKGCDHRENPFNSHIDSSPKLSFIFYWR